MVAAANHFQPVLALNETFMKDINALADKCGFTSFLEEAISYPPKRKFPQPEVTDECDVYDLTASAAFDLNPCFNIYHLTEQCPVQKSLPIY